MKTGVNDGGATWRGSAAESWSKQASAAQRVTLYNLEKESSDPAGGELDHLLDVNMNKPALLVAGRSPRSRLLCHVSSMQDMAS